MARLHPLQTALLSGFVTWAALVGPSAAQGQDGSSGEGESGATVELPLVGEVPVPDFIADLLGLDRQQPQEQGQGQSAPTAVVFETADPVPVGETYSFIGRIAPIERVEIRVRITGFIEEVTFDGGETVSEGDVLFRIQSEQYEAALAAAQARLSSATASEAEAERELARNQELRESGTVAQAALDTAIAAAEAARAQTEQAAAAVRQAELDLSYTTIEAPIDGKISAPLITRGNFVSPTSTALANLVQVDPIWGVFSLSETRLQDWRALGLGGTGAADAGGADWRLSLVLPDDSDYAPAGEFSFVGNEVDPQTGSVEVRVRFANPDAVLLPNQNVSLRVSEIDPPVLPVVPQAAVQLSRDGRAVWVVRDDDTVSRLPVEITAGPDPGQVAITSGLEGGERVITRGAQQLEEGQTVDPRTAGGPTGGQGNGSQESDGGANQADERQTGGSGSDEGESGSGEEGSGEDGSGESDGQ